MLAINANDSEQRILQYFRDSRFTFKPVMGGIEPLYTVGKAYGVEAYPTNYLLDSRGRVVWRDAGWDEPALRAALAGLGIR